MSTLVIYEQIPEACNIYFFDGVDEELYNKLKDAHGKYVNVSEMDDALLKFMCSFEEKYGGNRIYASLDRNWIKSLVVIGKLDVFHMGFAL